MNNFKNETGYTKHGRKQQHQAALPPPRPQLVRPLPSRQQDPLVANMSHPPPVTSVPTTTAPPPAPAPVLAAQPAAATPVEVQEVAPTSASAPAPAPTPTPALALDHLSPMHSASQSEPPPPG